MHEKGNPQQTLLGELESIIDILDDIEPGNDMLFDLEKHSAHIAGIPMLEDVVNNSPQTDSLLDLDRIFSDPDYNSDEQALSRNISAALNSITEAPQLATVSQTNRHTDQQAPDLFPLLDDILASAQPVTNPPPSPKRNSNYHSDITLMVQELVDEMIPELEARLREQLSQLAPEMIRELAEKHLNK